MPKNLLVLALLVSAVPVKGYAHSDKAKHGQPSQPTPQQAAPVPPQRPDGESLQSEPYPKEPYDVRVVHTPDKDAWDKAAVGVNIALAIIGFAGVIAAFITLSTLRKQTRATRTSVELQEIGFRQWVEIDDWENLTPHLQPNVKNAMIVIRFKVGNTTKFPFTLREVTVRRMGQVDTFAPNTQIAPETGYPGDVIARVDIGDLQKYWKNDYTLGVQIEVLYEDVLKKIRPAKFLYTITCGPTCCRAQELSNQHWDEIVGQISSEPAPKAN